MVEDRKNKWKEGRGKIRNGSKEGRKIGIRKRGRTEGIDGWK